MSYLCRQCGTRALHAGHGDSSRRQSCTARVRVVVQQQRFQPQCTERMAVEATEAGKRAVAGARTS
eukprot:1948453-Prorocentrum_lima.AAC.1